MHIDIAERLRPYSHLPGTYFALPGSTHRLQVFPALIRIDDFSGPTPKELAVIKLDIQGPLEGFTVEQDLEKGYIRVWGHSRVGFLRYVLKAAEDGILLTIEKAPQETLSFKIEGLWKLSGTLPAAVGSSFFVGPQLRSPLTLRCFEVPSLARLSLGSSKAQDWTLMRKRLDMTDILPIWHRLGQIMKPGVSDSVPLLARCHEAMKENAPEKILVNFRDVFLAGFDQGLSPRLTDTDHQGIAPFVPVGSQMSPLNLLAQGSACIQELFVQESGKQIHLLPALPPEFHCGRLTNVSCGKSGGLHLEWSKKAPRRAIFVAQQDQQLAFVIGGGKKSCRLRSSYQEKGVTYDSGTLVNIIAGQNYWLDNFQS